MTDILVKLGIKQFINSSYIFKPKDIDLFNNGTIYNTNIEVETWELKNGYKYININLGVDNNWSTALSVKFKDETLFDKTIIADYIGERIEHRLELSLIKGNDDFDSYYFTSDYNKTREVFYYLISLLGELELQSQKDKDLSDLDYEPYSAFNRLIENIEVYVKDKSDIDELIDVITLFLESEGEDYRAQLFLDHKLIYTKDLHIQITQIIEDIMYEEFFDDEILLEED